MIPPDQVEVVEDFTGFGIHAFTTTRDVGSFSTCSEEPVRTVMARWAALQEVASRHGVGRLATAVQVHGANLVVHVPGWSGWLRGPRADGHVAMTRGTALAITVADCAPVFITHPSGAVALLHSGWRGTAARIVEHAIATLERCDFRPPDLRIHLGPAICGACYEVSPDVFTQVTGEQVNTPRALDLRVIIAQQARAMGVADITISASCTKHHNERFFSHRAGDLGRQVSAIFAAPNTA